MRLHREACVSYASFSQRAHLPREGINVGLCQLADVCGQLRKPLEYLAFPIDGICSRLLALVLWRLLSASDGRQQAREMRWESGSKSPRQSSITCRSIASYGTLSASASMCAARR